MAVYMSFDTAKRIAAKKGLPEAWAYRFHNPAQDNFALLKIWRNMKASPAKDELKAKISLNPALYKSLEVIDRLSTYLVNAVKIGDLKKVKQYIELGVEPSAQDLSTAIRHGDIEIVNELLKLVEPSRNHRYEAMKKGNLEVIKALNQRGPN